jgi:hypothetical protein
MTDVLYTKSGTMQVEWSEVKAAKCKYMSPEFTRHRRINQCGLQYKKRGAVDLSDL